MTFPAKGIFSPLLVFLSTLALAPIASADEFRCGGFEQNFGPFDYRVAPADKKQLVERAHFTRSVENLVKGSSGYLGTDLSYTLIVFPNHPRALRSMMELEFKTKTGQPAGARYPVWCYFDRAVRFKADDAQVRMIYGIYLQRKGKPQEAVEQLLVAEQFAGENANLLYNIGLVYLNLGNHDKALTYAHRAYAMDYPLEGLRNRLKRAGKWKEPANQPVESKDKNHGREEAPDSAKPRD